jgi:hypothetical protein
VNEEASFRSVSLAATAHAARFLAHPGTTGFGMGLRTVAGMPTLQPVAKVFVERKLPLQQIAPDDVLPRYLTLSDGRTLAVDVEELEPIQVPPPRRSAPAALAVQSTPLRGYLRPACGGASIANYLFPVGTLGITVVDFTGSIFVLSCNHVLGLLNKATNGQPVLQPAPEDGGNAASQIGTFARLVPLRFSKDAINSVDAALALVPAGATVPNIGYLGQPRGLAPRSSLSIGQPVWKVGRTSGLTGGYISALNVVVPANYSSMGGPSVGFLGDQILTTAMAEYGDSGSILFDSSFRVVGMLCGGSANGAIFNHIENVLAALGVSL